MTTTTIVTRGWMPEGTVNWRDLGDLPARHGSRLMPGRLFRSDTLQELNPDDVTTVTGLLGVRTVVDLRYRQESLVEGSGLLGRTSVTHHRLPMVGRDGDDSTHALPGDEADHLVPWYLSMLEVSPEHIAQAFILLAHPGSLPAVVHCAAGKDRTGVLVALVLSSIGVADDVVAWDYARSTLALPRILSRLATMQTYGAQPAGLRPERNRTEASTMLNFLAGVRARHGSVERYLHGIGVSRATIDDLHAALTRSE